MTARPSAVAALVLSTFAFAEEPSPGSAPMPAAVSRPEAPSVGVSVGWTFPQSILEPNTFGVRFRLASVTLEPSVRLGGSTTGQGDTSTTTVPGAAASTSTTNQGAGGFDVSAGTLVRYAVASKGPVDLHALVGASVGFSSQTRNTTTVGSAAVDRRTISGLSAGLSWGLGLEWFIGHELSLSADATNPLVTYTSSKTTTHLEQPIGTDKAVTDTDASTSGFDGAISFRPTVRVQLCLYF